MRGIIEGFYGTPWSWDERRAVCQALSGTGMDTYVYAPKDDPLHRERWREHYGEPFLRDLSELVEDDSLRVGFAISPGLSMDPLEHSDRTALLGKLEPVLETGVELVGLLLDDIPPGADLGTAHGRLTQWLRDALPAEVELFFVPTHYTGTVGVPYLEQLASTVPEEVPIGWTGPYVVNDTIDAADAERWADAMGGRRPLLWDNTPCNDAVMADRLMPGPLLGRDRELPEHLSGYLANPMVQALVSVPALVSAAAWLEGCDPVAAWEGAVGEHAVLAEACQPFRLRSLVESALDGDAGSRAELRGFLERARGCTAGGLGAAVEPWVRQVRVEAEVAKVALDALEMPPAEAAALLPLLLVMWPPLRTAEVSVLGGRGGVRPMMGQDPNGNWVCAEGAWIPPASLVDDLVAAAHRHLGAGGAPR